MAGVKRRLLEAEERRAGRMTLADVADQGLNVFCWCNRCGHNAVLPTRMLLPQLGPAFPVPDIGAQMRCSGCGSKDVATRPDWPSLGLVSRHSPGPPQPPLSASSRAPSPQDSVSGNMGRAPVPSPVLK